MGGGKKDGKQANSKFFWGESDKVRCTIEKKSYTVFDRQYFVFCPHVAFSFTFLLKNHAGTAAYQVFKKILACRSRIMLVSTVTPMVLTLRPKFFLPRACRAPSLPGYYSDRGLHTER